MNDKKQLGVWAEDTALAYLKKQNLLLIERNFNTARGEIDLIMQDAHVLVFTEVRYRKNQNFGGALASVTRNKQQRLILAAQTYLNSHKKLADSEARFDVISIEGEAFSGNINIEWIKNAFINELT